MTSNYVKLKNNIKKKIKLLKYTRLQSTYLNESPCIMDEFLSSMHESLHVYFIRIKNFTLTLGNYNFFESI